MAKHRRLALGVAGILVIAGSAAAQTSAPMPAGTATATFLTDQAVGQFRASKLVGVDVYGPESQKVGDVNEILIDATGTARAAVIGVGGFLGIGEKNVALPWSALTWVNARNAASVPAPGTGINPAPVPTTAPTDPAATAAARAVRTPDEEAAYNGYPDHATITLTKSDLQNAPAFKYYADTHRAATTPGATPPAASMPVPGGAPATAPRP